MSYISKIILMFLNTRSSLMRAMIRISLITLVVNSSFLITSAQVGINEDGSSPSVSAMLDVKSTTKGMLTPRMTAAQRTAISSPATGLLVYDTDTKTFWYYDNAKWNEIPNSAATPTIPDPADGTGCIEIVRSKEIFTNYQNDGLLISGNYAYIMGIYNVIIMDISNAASAIIKGSVPISGNGSQQKQGLAIVGNYVYALSSAAGVLEVINVSNPNSPTIIGSLNISGGSNSITAVGNYAYITCNGSDDLKIIDISNPASPTLSGSISVGSNPHTVEVSGNYVYVGDASNNDLRIINVSNPAAPTQSGTLSMGATTNELTISGNYLYTASSNGIKVVNISNPSTPTLSGSLNISGNPNSITIANNYAYLSSTSDIVLTCVNVSNPASPTLYGSLTFGASTDHGMSALANSNGYIFGLSASSSGTGFLNIVKLCTDIIVDYTTGQLVRGKHQTTIDEFKLQNNNLLLSLSNDGEEAKELNLSSFKDNTDNQALSLNNNTLALTNGGSVNLSNINTDNQKFDASQLNGNNLELSLSNDGEPTKSIDMSSLKDNLGNHTATQNIQLNGKWLSNDGGDEGVFVNTTGQVGIGTSSPTASAMLDVQSTTKGMLTPRMTTAQRTAISSPATGLLVYDTDTKTFWYYENSKWNEIRNGTSQLNYEDLVGGEKYDCIDTLGSVGINIGVYSIIISGDYAYVGSLQDFHIINISNPNNPTVIGSLNLFISWDVRKIIVVGNNAYLIIGDHFKIIDISDKTNPVLNGDINLGSFGDGLIISGTYAYVRTAYNLKVFNISNPTNPTVVASLNLSTNTNYNSLVLLGNHLYSSSTNGIDIIDISTPTAPSVISQFNMGTNSQPTRMVKSGDFVYVGTYGSKKLEVLNISTPTNPIISGSLSLTNSVDDVIKTGNYVFATTSLGNTKKLNIIDVSIPTNPILKYQLGQTNHRFEGIATSSLGNYIYTGKNVVGSNTSASKFEILSICSEVRINPSTGQLENVKQSAVDNQTLDIAQLNGNNLELSLSNDGQTTKTIDLGSFNQTLDVAQLNGNNLELSLSNDGQTTKTIDLGSFNQTLDASQLNGNNLELSLSNDGQPTKSINLSSLKDNLGNHTATQIITLGSHRISGDGGNEGIHVNNTGDVHIYNPTDGATLSLTGGLGVSDDAQIIMGAGNGTEKWRIETQTSGLYGYNGSLVFLSKEGDQWNAPMVEQMRVNKDGKLGLGITPQNHMDIAYGTRTGSHATGRPLYVTGNLGAASNGIEFRHSNGMQGLGFGYNTIYATGSTPNQDINILPRGAGKVGIGTSTPTRGKVEISGFVNYTYPTGHTMDHAGSIYGIAGQANATSIYASHAISGHRIVAYSDARIKNIKGVSNREKDLKIINQIEITDYTMIDTISKGHRSYKKVIAQQVKDIFPQAVTTTTDVVPDIYQRTTLKDGWIQLETDLKVGERVEIFTDNNEGVYKVTVVEPTRFQVEKLSTQNSKPETVFVFGREVNDFHSVDYDAISMLNVSATQALYDIIQQLERDNETLKSDNEQLKAQATKINQLEAMFHQLQQQLSTSTTVQAISEK